MALLGRESLSHLLVPESTKPVTKEGLLHHFPGSSCSSVTSSGLAQVAQSRGDCGQGCE